MAVRNLLLLQIAPDVLPATERTDERNTVLSGLTESLLETVVAINRIEATVRNYLLLRIAPDVLLAPGRSDERNTVRSALTD